MIDQVKALAVFAKIAECGTFREAARALSLSPSVVSHYVTELERRLEVTLLYRSTRRLALTPPSLGVYAVWPGSSGRPTLTTRFVDFMEDRLQALFGAR